MSTLILTCDTGEGHNSCAKAIKEVYDANGIPCEIINPVRFVAAWFARFVHWVHTTTYQKHTKVFRVGYRFTEKYNRLTTARGSFPYWVLSFGAEKLHEHIVRNGVSQIICVHPLLMMMVSEQQRKYGLDCPVAFVSTDYTCCPGVSDSSPDICFIPDLSLKNKFFCKNGDVKIISSGIPVRQQFYKATDKETAKQHFHIPKDSPHLVMTCGSMGCGPMEEMLEILSRQNDIHITVVCGTNEKLQNRLSEKYTSSNVHIRGYIKEMSMLMDSADVFVTKPGGLCSTEAAVKCVPMVFVNAVGGCENYNLEFFVQRRCAVAGESYEETARLCCELLRSGEMRSAMTTALEMLHLPNAAHTILETMQME